MTTTTKTYLCEIEDCTRPVQARSMCGPHYGTWHKRQKRYRITCAGCGTEAMVGTKTRRYCTANCLRRANGKARQREAIARRLPVPYTGSTSLRMQRAVVKAALAANGTAADKTWTAGPCAICGRPFLTRSWSESTARCCSHECAVQRLRDIRRSAKHRRRAAQRSAYRSDVQRRKVYAADGYRCHICGRKTDPSKAAPHPRSPTIDHVIPLAQGGTHEPINCRTACFLCNSIKGARGGGEQLLLLAI
ncbi:HNH endonuclease [Nocardia cyriacigeorgica]|uniref:HNH endonuclease n=1 Tax=Nocardia cyriacigeorgica TaxID=135487 RepID=A0A6P1CMM2_9NOCA|nr:HNH endonuclease [Nocardia cyriacigeorgica]NEW33829.1 HNH endonuclease [Nocardia cyriacigeorgica]